MFIQDACHWVGTVRCWLSDCYIGVRWTGIGYIEDAATSGRLSSILFHLVSFRHGFCNFFVNRPHFVRHCISTRSKSAFIREAAISGVILCWMIITTFNAPRYAIAIIAHVLYHWSGLIRFACGFLKATVVWSRVNTL